MHGDRSKWDACLTRWEKEPSIAKLTAFANDGMIAQLTEQFAHLHDLDSGSVPIPAVLPTLQGEQAWRRSARRRVRRRVFEPLGWPQALTEERELTRPLFVVLLNASRRRDDGGR